jgi:exonuclease III
LSDAFAKTGCGAGISYNQNLFLFRIDNIFHSPNLEAYNCTVDRSIKLSDHYPIYCYFRIL